MNVLLTVPIRYSHIIVTVSVVTERLSLTGHHRESVPVPLPVILFCSFCSLLLWQRQSLNVTCNVNAAAKAVTFFQVTCHGTLRALTHPVNAVIVIG